MRLKAGEIGKSLGRYRPVFTKEEEVELADHCRLMEKLFFGMTLRILRSVAYQFAEEKKIKHGFSKTARLAGKDWARKFMRNHGLSLRTPVKTSVARMMGFNQSQVALFFENLSNLKSKYQFSARQIFNVDETGLSTVPNRLPKVVSEKGKRLVSKVVSAERGELTTVIACINAAGEYVPPGIVFKR